MDLRPYQFPQMVQPVRHAFATGAKRPLLVAPTGSGKTATFSYMMRGAVQRGNPSWVLVHRDILVRQASRSLTAWGCPHGILAAGGEMDDQTAQVVSIQTLASRLKKGWTPKTMPRFIIADEAHHACSNSWRGVFDRFKGVPTLGVTATPCRLDGKGLGDIFDRMLIGPTTSQLIADGYLARPRYFGVPPSQALDLKDVDTVGGDYNRAQLAKLIDEKPRLTGDVVDHYKTRANGLKFIGFACNLKHASKLRDAFVAAGVPCDVIHGEMSDREREDMIARLDRGELKGLWSVDLVSEGFDLPEVSCVILCRPTKSLNLHIQQIGRGGRKFPGKDWFVVLDHVGNLMRLGTWEMEQEWTLDGVNRKKRDKEVLQAVRQCERCFVFHPRSAPCCPECGHVATVAERVLKTKAGTLKELSAKEIEAESRRVKLRQAQGRCQTYDQLVRFAVANGMSAQWAWRVWQGRKAKASGSQRLAAATKII